MVNWRAVGCLLTFGVAALLWVGGVVMAASAVKW